MPKEIRMVNKPAADRISFSERMIQILNDGALNLALAIGYRTGLLDAMDLTDAPQTADHISQQTGLNRRYIDEWLGIMVTGEIVELSLSPDGRNLFYLPKQWGDLLTRRAGNANLGVYTQEVPLLTNAAMEPVVNGFKTGEGVTYDHYPKFQKFMSQLADAKHCQVLVDRFLPSVDDGRIIEQLQAGIRVCDLGCAEGVALVLMAKAFPRSRFIGIDISQNAITNAQRKARRQQISNLEFMALDAAWLQDHRQLRESFAYVTAFDAIHDQTRPLEVLKGIHYILAPDGLFSMVDIAAESNLADNLSHPMAPFLYTVSLMHCMPVGLVDDGAGLGMMWGRQKAVDMLEEAGFQNIRVLEIPDDPFNLHFLSRK
jgi:ubiquinone/menaquinone biosynthesis C-methylase UbiE